MPEFRGEAFLPLFQRKREIEEERRNPLSKAIAIAGEVWLGRRQQKQQSDYQLGSEMIRDFFKENKPVKIIDLTKPFSKDNIEPLSVQEEMYLINNIAAGKGLNEIPNNIKFVPAKYFEPEERKSDRPVLWRNEKTGKVFTKSEKGDLIEVSAVPYNAIVYALGKTPADIEKRAQNIKSLSRTVNVMKEMLDKIPSGEGIMGRITGYTEIAKGELGYSSNAKVYADYKEAILGQIVTTIGGETGSRISDQDANRMRNALPSLQSTTSERELKWKTFFKIANAVSESYGGNVLFPEVENIEKEKDQYGYILGQTFRDENGRIHKYMGDNQWTE